MFGIQSNLYSRSEFIVENKDDLRELSLTLQFDDGFVAYLNGTLVASENAPEGLSWLSNAVAAGNDERVHTKTFDLTDHLEQLKDGTNVFAIHGLNQTRVSNEFVLIPELVAGRG